MRVVGVATKEEWPLQKSNRVSTNKIKITKMSVNDQELEDLQLKRMNKYKKKAEEATNHLNCLQAQYDKVLSELNEMKQLVQSLGLKKKKNDVEIDAVVTVKNRFDILEVMDQGENAITTESEFTEMRTRKAPGKKTFTNVFDKPVMRDEPVLKKVIPMKKVIKPQAPIRNELGAEEISNETEMQNEKSPQRDMNGRIKVYNLDAKKVTNAMKEQGIEIIIKPGVTQDVNMINCNSKERQKVFDYISKETNARGHSYQTRDERYEGMVLKAIPVTFDSVDVMDSITEELNKRQLQITGKYRVQRLRTYHSAANGYLQPHHVVQTENKDMMDKIMSLPAICSVKAIWDQMKKPMVTQCYNCYDLGHTMAGGCLNDTMCKRCGFRGEGHECTVEYKPDAENPYEDYTCGWCNEKGHPPTWTGCTHWTDRKNAIGKAQAKKNRDKMIRFNNRTSNDKITFVSAPLPTRPAWNLGEQSQRQPPQLGNTPKRSMEEAIKESLGIDMGTAHLAVEKFQRKYSEARTTGEKHTAFAMYLLELNNWSP